MKKHSDNSDTAPDIYSVPVEEAVCDIAALYQHRDLPTKAFTIHAEDFLQALGYRGDSASLLDQCDYRYARIYLGGKVQTVNGVDKLVSMNLFVIPVEGADINNPDHIVAGTDIIPNGPFKRKKLQELLENGPHVYDLIAPCPGSCDYTSDLYEATLQTVSGREH